MIFSFTFRTQYTSMAKTPCTCCCPNNPMVIIYAVILITLLMFPCFILWHPVHDIVLYFQEAVYFHGQDTLYMLMHSNENTVIILRLNNNGVSNDQFYHCWDTHIIFLSFQGRSVLPWPRYPVHADALKWEYCHYLRLNNNGVSNIQFYHCCDTLYIIFLSFPGRSIFPWPRHPVHAAALEWDYRHHLRLYSHHSPHVPLFFIWDDMYITFPLLAGRSIFPWPRHSVHAVAQTNLWS